jgi:arylsulfatase A-like enzyme
MSLELTFPKNSLDQASWQTLLHDFAADLNPYSGLDFFPEDQPIAHLLTPQSIRGVLLRIEPEGMRLRVNAWGSRADWRHAYAIAKSAQEAGGGEVRKAGAPIPSDNLCDAAANFAAAEDFRASVDTAIQMFKHEKDCFRLPIGTFMVDIARADLPALGEWNAGIHDALEAQLCARVSRYAVACFAQPRQLEGEHTLANWNQGPTILPKVDYLSLNGPWHVCDGVVPLPAALAILGTTAEEVGDHENPAWFLPAIDFESDTALTAEFAKAAVALDSLAPEDSGIAFPEEWQAEFPYRYEDVEPICLKLTELLPDHPDPVALVAAMRKSFNDRALVDAVLDSFQVFMSVIGPDDEETQQPAVVAAEMTKKGVPERLAIFAVIAFLGGAASQDDLRADVDRIFAMIADKTQAEFSSTGEQASITAELIASGLDPVRAAALVPDAIDALITLTALLQESPDDVIDRMTAAEIDPALAQAVIASVRSSQREPADGAKPSAGGCLGVFLACLFAFLFLAADGWAKPNIVFIMADDLGYGDLGCYGQKEIQTPNIDQLAGEGTRFTNCYAGAPVCAPSRSVLMTGRHTGHTTVRGNFGKGGVKGLGGGSGRVPLRADDVTVAEVLKSAGYTTGMAGKWGLGEPGTTGLPNDQGFDEWFGYLNQRRAHTYYPSFVWLNRDKFPLPGNTEGKREQYTHDLTTDFALSFLDTHAGAEAPFFLYLPYAVPHSKYEIPSVAPYEDKPWSMNEKVHAAMITRLDRDLGRLRKRLRDKGVDGNTLIFFCSDNGAASRWSGRFDSSGALRGRKRDLSEGGIRTPMIVHWPNKVPAGATNDAIWYFADVLPTLAEFAGAPTPLDIDGVSIGDAILGKTQPELMDRLLYWEFYEGGFKQAARRGKWKVIRPAKKPMELYNLEVDEGERKNLASQHPERIAEFAKALEQARTPSPHWAAPID